MNGQNGSAFHTIDQRLGYDNRHGNSSLYPTNYSPHIVHPSHNQSELDVHGRPYHQNQIRHDRNRRDMKYNNLGYDGEENYNYRYSEREGYNYNTYDYMDEPYIQYQVRNAYYQRNVDRHRYDRTEQYEDRDRQRYRRRDRERYDDRDRDRYNNRGRHRYNDLDEDGLPLPTYDNPNYRNEQY